MLGLAEIVFFVVTPEGELLRMREGKQGNWQNEDGRKLFVPSMGT